MRREKEHATLVNHEILLKRFIFRETLKRSHFDEENKNIGRWSMIKYCRISLSWTKFYNDLILIKTKGTSHVRQWWNIAEINHDQRDSKMITFWQRPNEHRMLVNNKISLKFILVRQILKWSHFQKRKRTSHVGQLWNTAETLHIQRNSKMISFWRTEKEHRTSINDKILSNFIIVNEILQWSHFDQDKRNIARSSMMKYCWN